MPTTTVPIVQPRFSTRTDVSSGSFAERLRERVFGGRGFSNTNNNPMPTAQAVTEELQPMPPTEERQYSFRRQTGGGSRANP
jgi:hypothetical protein